MCYVHTDVHAYMCAEGERVRARVQCMGGSIHAGGIHVVGRAHLLCAHGCACMQRTSVYRGVSTHVQHMFG